MFDNVLVVCVGNICRSPIGEYMLRKKLPGKAVHSAGLAARNDMPAAEHSVTVSAEHGLDILGHKARKLTAEICAQSELILVMEPEHLKAIGEVFPQARGKAMLIGKWINKEIIPDPHRQERPAFEHVYALLEEATTAWAARL